MLPDQLRARPILNKVKQWLSPPVFEGDEEKTRLARIGNTIALAVIAILGVYTFARPQSGGSITVTAELRFRRLFQAEMDALNNAIRGAQTSKILISSEELFSAPQEADGGHSSA